MSDAFTHARRVSPAEVLTTLQHLCGVEVPDDFRPTAPLHRESKALFGPCDRIDERALIQAGIDVFLSAGPDGLYRIGLWGHGASSHAFYLQQRVAGRTLFLRLPWGGVDVDVDHQMRLINRYLAVLSRFLRDCDRRAIDVEIVESMGIGRYRLFDADGDGIECERSLLESEDLEKQLNGMLAEFAIEISRRKIMQTFIDDDAGYRRWLAGNPTGYVINCAKKGDPGYVMLHRSQCWSISHEDKNYTHGSYQKVCSTDTGLLEQWAKDVKRQGPTPCRFCLD